MGNLVSGSLTAAANNVAGDVAHPRTFPHQRGLGLWLFTLLVRALLGYAYNVHSIEQISIAPLAHLVYDTLG
jgi:hypothetical protein